MMDFSTIRDQFTCKCKEILNADEIKTQDIILLAKWFRNLEKTTFTPSNAKDFVVLIINFFINLQKFSELKKFQSQFLTTFRVTCGTILHVIDVLNIHSLVIKRSSRIFKLITSNYAQSVCTKELLKIFNVCLSKAASRIIEETADKHKIVVCNLYRLIEDTSDVELQFVVLEAVLRFFHTKGLRRILHQLAPKNEKLKTILESEDSDLYGTIRSYINELNKNSSYIISIKCDLISLDSAVFENLPNRNCPIKEAWLDFDLKERRISFFCNKEFLRNISNKLIFPTLTEWEVVSFFAEDKIKIDFIYCDGVSGGTIKLMIKLNTRNINLYCDTQSEMVKTLVIATSLDSPESDKLTSEILPQMFPDSFNLEANSQVSSYHGLWTPVRESETPDLLLQRVTSPEIRFERDRFLKVRTDEELERSLQKRSNQQDDDYFTLTQCHLSNDYKADCSNDCIIIEDEDVEVNLSHDLKQMFRNPDRVTRRMSKGPCFDISESKNSTSKVKMSTLNRSDTANDSSRDDQSVREIFRNSKENVPKLSKQSVNYVTLNKSISPMSFARSLKSPAVRDMLTEETEYGETINVQMKKNAFTKLSKGNPMSLTNSFQSSMQVLQLGKEQSRGLLSGESFPRSSEDVEVLSHTKVEKWLSHSGDVSKYSDLLTVEHQVISIDEEPNELPNSVCEEPQNSSEVKDTVEPSVEPLKRNRLSAKRKQEEVVNQTDPILKKNSNKDDEVISECLLNENEDCQANNKNVTLKMSKKRNDLLMSPDLTNDEEHEKYSCSELSEADESNGMSYRNKIKKKMTKNKRNSAKTNKTAKTFKINSTTKKTKKKRAKRDSVLTTVDPIQNILTKTENFSKMSNCVVVLENVLLTPEKKRSSGFNCLPLEARKKAEEIRLLNERSMASIASSKNSSEKIPLFFEESLNENKRLQSPEKVKKTRKPSSAKKSKPNKQDAISKKSCSDEDCFKLGLVTEVETSEPKKKKVIKNRNLDNQKNKANTIPVPISVSPNCEDVPKSVRNTEKVDKKNEESPEKVIKRRRSVSTKKNVKDPIHQKLNSYPLHSNSSDDASQIISTKHVEDKRNSPKNVTKHYPEKIKTNQATSENVREPSNAKNAANPLLIAENNEKVSSQDGTTSFSQAVKDSESASMPDEIEKNVASVQCEDISTTRHDCFVNEKSLTSGSSVRNSPVEKSLDSEKDIEINHQDLNRSSSDATKDRVDSTLQSIFKGLSDSEDDVDMLPLKPMRTNELIDALETQVTQQVGVEEAPKVACLEVDSTLQDIFKGLSDSESDVDMLPLEPMRTNELLDVLEPQASQPLAVKEVPKAICVSVDDSVISEPIPTTPNQKVPELISKTKPNKTLKHVPLPQHPENQESMSLSFTKSSPDTSENRNNRKLDILNSSQLKINETIKSRGVKRNTRKLFDADDMSYLDECLNRDTEIWEAKMKEHEQVVPSSTGKKNSSTKRQAGVNKKRTPKTHVIGKNLSKKRALVQVFGQKIENTDVSLIKTQEQIIRLRQMVQEKKKEPAKKRKLKKEADSDSDTSVEIRNRSKKPKINIISHVVIKPFGDRKENTGGFDFGMQEYTEFQVQQLVNALSFALGRDLGETRLSKALLKVIDEVV